MEHHLDIVVHNIFKINLFGQEMFITETIRNTWIIMAVIIAIAIYIRIKLNSFKEVPTGLQNVVELIVETMDKFVTGTLGKKNAHFSNWFLTVFILMYMSNIAGLVFLRPPTADYATALMFALTTFVLIHVMGIKRKGLFKYLGFYVKPNPVFLPIHVVGELAKPVSLGFRLLGNILGGFIILELIYGLPIYFRPLIPVPLHFYLDVFVGFVQTFIFTTLSMTFMAEHMGVHEEEGHSH